VIEGAAVTLIDHRKVVGDPEWFHSDCKLDVAWSTAAGRFRWTGWVHVVDQVPLRASSMRIDKCQARWPDRPDLLFRRMSYSRGGPELAELRPAPDAVVIPLDGEASLDDVRASAAFDVPWLDTMAPTVTVTVHGGPSGPSRYPCLRPGDSFPWGTHEATITRFVVPTHGAFRWVEIGL
jgi:hypothetical protein